MKTTPPMQADQPNADAPAVRSSDVLGSVQRLQNWYAAQCNGDWEHSYGVSIETLDNPGWWVEIELCDTSKSELKVEVRGKDITIETVDGVLIGTCDAKSLDELLNQMATHLGA